MKTFICIFKVMAAIAVLPLLSVSCGKETVPVQKTGVVFGAHMSSDSLFAEKTKSAEVTSLSSFYVCATESDHVTPADDGGSAFINNSVFTLVGGTTDYVSDKAWPATSFSNGLEFYAANKSIAMNGSVAPFVSTDNSTDVVTAYMSNPTVLVKNELTFYHVFTRINSVTVTAASGFTLSNVSIKVHDCKDSGTYDIRSGLWTATSSSGDATVYGPAGTGTQNPGLNLCPGSTTFWCTWTATWGSRTTTFENVPCSLNLVKGTKYDLSVELSGLTNMIEFTMDFHQWSDFNEDIFVDPSST